MFSINEICEWAGTNPSQRNFREGENILRAGHLISCGKHKNETCESGSVKLTAYCLQTSQLHKEHLHMKLLQKFQKLEK